MTALPKGFWQYMSREDQIAEYQVSDDEKQATMLHTKYVSSKTASRINIHQGKPSKVSYLYVQNRSSYCNP